MIEAHGGLGELLVVLYLAVAVGSLLASRRGGLPAWVTGTAHALLGVQIVMGLILLVRYPSAVPWTHPLFGLLTVPALALAAPLRRRFGRARGVALDALLIAVLAGIALAIAKTA